MSVIFEALHKLRKSERDFQEANADEAPPANVYTIKGLLFSPQGLLGIAIIVFLIGGLAYYGADYIQSVSQARKVQIVSAQDSAGSYNTARYSEKVSGSQEEVCLEVPPPPATGIRYEKPAKGKLYLPSQTIASHQSISKPQPNALYLPPKLEHRANRDLPNEQSATSGSHLEASRPSVKNVSEEKETNVREETGERRASQTHEINSEPVLASIGPRPESKGVVSQGAHSTATTRVTHIRNTQEDKVYESRIKTAKISQLVIRLQGAMIQGDDSQVKKLLPRLETLKGTNDPFVLKLKAFWRMKKGEYGKAADLLVKVLGENPNDVEAGLNMAIIEIKMGQFDKARKRLRALYERHNEDSQVLDLLRKISG